MDVNVDLPPKMSDSVAGMFNPFCLTQIKEIFSTNPGYVSDGFVEIFKHENFIILFFCKIAYFIIGGPFMWKFFVQIFEILSDGINATQRLFYWTWQCFFRYEQPWCIFSAMILVLDKYEVFRSIYSEKSILNSFHLKKDLRIEKVNFKNRLTTCHVAD